jgi:hypothetical protein
MSQGSCISEQIKIGHFSGMIFRPHRGHQTYKFEGIFWIAPIRKASAKSGCLATLLTVALSGAAIDGFLWRKGAVMPSFVCMTQPDGLWMVWDNRRDEPAAIGDRPLVGLEKTRAETVCDVLERIVTGKLTLRKGHSD